LWGWLVKNGTDASDFFLEGLPVPQGSKGRANGENGWLLRGEKSRKARLELHGWLI